MLPVLPVPKLIRYRPRAAIALVIGIVAAFVAPVSLRPLVRVVLGWDIAVWSYLVLIWWLMARAPQDMVREIAIREDETATTFLLVVCIAAVASIAAIVLELATVKDLGLGAGLAHLAFTVATLFGAWFLIPTMFALHYARLFYGSAQERTDEPALSFPDSALEPNYWDFLYFSFTIALTSQTSDVALRSRPIRKAVLAQSVLSFYFNIAVLGLCVNVAAGLINL
ncbi:DUF1345 domain-containing protein [Cupriavidus necator]|uniref:DUF1345 domain-containing protein n=1 Tax=Cupriavidus necator TaxID=106590 RepID=UPI0012D2F0CA|nr:DUF1345 domain-containing protein [Cupriavidus necator]